jgi:hypothetical protein
MGYSNLHHINAYKSMDEYKLLRNTLERQSIRFRHLQWFDFSVDSYRCAEMCIILD